MRSTSYFGQKYLFLRNISSQKSISETNIDLVTNEVYLKQISWREIKQ